MNTVKTSLGERIKYFRSREGMSQSQLEIETDIAFGTLSRVENGQTNPTKESLLKIADVLKLNNDEIIYLIYPDKLFVTQQDIEEVLTIVKKRIDMSLSPVYLLDNLRRVVYTGEAALQLFGFSKEKKDQVVGAHILELIFNPLLPVRSMFGNDFERLAHSRVKAFQHDLSYLINNGELSETLEYLGQFPNFTEIWGKAMKSEVDPYSKEERTFTLRLEGQTYSFYFINTPIDEDRRFELIEYFPG